MVVVFIVADGPGARAGCGGDVAAVGFRHCVLVYLLGFDAKKLLDENC